MAQQQHGTSNNQRGLAQRIGNGSGSGGGGGYQQPAYKQPGAMGQRMDYTPTPYKRFENWNYCHTAPGLMANLKETRNVEQVGRIEATNDKDLYDKKILVVVPKRKL
jgi:hypothetical protein